MSRGQGVKGTESGLNRYLLTKLRPSKKLVLNNHAGAAAKKALELHAVPTHAADTLTLARDFVQDYAMLVDRMLAAE